MYYNKQNRMMYDIFNVLKFRRHSVAMLQAEIERLKKLKESEKIFVVEENSKSSGMGTIISHLITSHSLPVKLQIFGLENKQLLEYGEREWLINKAKLDSDSITKKIIKENLI